ncbi:MAG: hypothetical protein V4629_06545 [Pseudomonadota bacterium]
MGNCIGGSSSRLISQSSINHSTVNSNEQNDSTPRSIVGMNEPSMQHPSIVSHLENIKVNLFGSILNLDYSKSSFSSSYDLMALKSVSKYFNNQFSVLKDGLTVLTTSYKLLESAEKSIGVRAIEPKILHLVEIAKMYQLLGCTEDFKRIINRAFESALNNAFDSTRMHETNEPVQFVIIGQIEAGYTREAKDSIDLKIPDRCKLLKSQLYVHLIKAQLKSGKIIDALKNLQVYFDFNVEVDFDEKSKIIVSLIEAGQEKQAFKFVDLAENERDKDLALSAIVEGYTSKNDIQKSFENIDRISEQFIKDRALIKIVDVQLKSNKIADAECTANLITKCNTGLLSIAFNPFRDMALLSIMQAKLQIGNFNGAEQTLQTFSNQNLLNNAQYYFVKALIDKGDFDRAHVIAKKYSNSYSFKAISCSIAISRATEDNIMDLYNSISGVHFSESAEFSSFDRTVAIDQIISKALKLGNVSSVEKIIDKSSNNIFKNIHRLSIGLAQVRLGNINDAFATVNSIPEQLNSYSEGSLKVEALIEVCKLIIKNSNN